MTTVFLTRAPVDELKAWCAIHGGIVGRGFWYVGDYSYGRKVTVENDKAILFKLSFDVGYHECLG